MAGKLESKVQEQEGKHVSFELRLQICTAIKINVKNILQANDVTYSIDILQNIVFEFKSS